MSSESLKRPFSMSAEFVGHPVELTVESANRRLELLGKRLPIPVCPMPEEGLPDLYLRAIGRNSERSASVSWHRLSGRNRVDFAHRNYVGLNVTDTEFSDFLGTPRGAVDIAPLRYEKMPYAGVSFFGTNIRFISLAGSRRVSPRFLADHGYQKAMWAIAPISFDARNHEFLLERCPVCNVELEFYRTRGLYWCHACGDEESNRGLVDLRAYPQPILELETYEHVDFACSLIDPALDPQRDLSGSLHPDLRAVDRAHVFEFIILLARLLDRVDGLDSTGAVKPENLDIAARAVRNWPKGLLEVGEIVRDLPMPVMPGYNHPIYREVTNVRYFVGIQRLVKNQLRSGLAPAANDRVDSGAKGRQVRLARDRAWARKLGGYDVRHREDRIALAVTLARASRPVLADSRDVGLPVLELVRLYEKGLAGCPDPSLAHFFVSPAVNTGSLREQMTELSNASKPGSCSLYDVATALTDAAVVWPDLLESIFTRQIEFHFPSGDGPLIRGVSVMKTDHITECRSTAKDDAIFDNVLLGTGEAAFYLGTRQSEVCSFIRSGFLDAERLTLQTVKEFRSSYICGGELLAFLQLMAKSGISPWATLVRMKSEVKPVHDRPALRDRAAVKQYLTDIGY